MAFIQNVELSYTVWKALEMSPTYTPDTIYYQENDLEFVPFFVDNANFLIFYTNITKFPPFAAKALVSGAYASLVLQDITYTAVNIGTSGNSITIQYVNDAPAVGQESVTVVGNAISVHIVSGASTAQQVLTAVASWNAYNGQINRSSASAELVGAVISGSTGNPQVTVGATALTGGAVPVTVLADFTTTYLSTATKVNSFMDGLADDLI